MDVLWVVSYVALWALVLFLGFLLLGTLRTLGLLSWRLDQLQATRPRRLGRDGLKPGTKAPDFNLQSVEGNEVALHGFAGRKVLLVFTQTVSIRSTHTCWPGFAAAPSSYFAYERRDRSSLSLPG